MIMSQHTLKSQPISSSCSIMIIIIIIVTEGPRASTVRFGRAKCFVLIVVGFVVVVVVVVVVVILNI